MNNQYKTYYVTTDADNYVTGITTKDTDGAFPINILSNDIAEFTDPTRMGLYKATKDGLYQVPGGKVLEQARQIEDLKSVTDQQSKDLATAQQTINAQSALNKQLLAQIVAVNTKLANK